MTFWPWQIGKASSSLSSSSKNTWRLDRECARPSICSVHRETSKKKTKSRQCACMRTFIRHGRNRFYLQVFFFSSTSKNAWFHRLAIVTEFNSGENNAWHESDRSRLIIGRRVKLYSKVSELIDRCHVQDTSSHVCCMHRSNAEENIVCVLEYRRATATSYSRIKGYATRNKLSLRWSLRTIGSLPKKQKERSLVFYLMDRRELCSPYASVCWSQYYMGSGTLVNRFFFTYLYLFRLYISVLV